MLHLDDPVPASWGQQHESGKCFHWVEFFRSVEQVERLRDVTSASSEMSLIIQRRVEAGRAEEALIMSELSF